MTDDPVPRVSVVLPVYNDEEYVGMAIESILQQTFKEFELIVVDDGSTDESPNIVGDFAATDDRIKVVTHTQNQGLPVALNTGIKHATGRYVMRQDADDLSYLDRMEKQVKFMEKNQSAAVVSGSIEVIDGEGDILYELNVPEAPDEVLDQRNPVIHGAVMMRREAIEAVDGYDEFYRFCQDYDLWVRISRSGYEIQSIPDIVYKLRRDDEVLSIERRRKIALYGLLARTESERKETLRDRATTGGLDTVYPGLSSENQAQYHRRLAFAHIEQGNRLRGVTHALSTTAKSPLSIKSYATFGLSLAPRSVVKFGLNRVSGR